MFRLVASGPDPPKPFLSIYLIKCILKVVIVPAPTTSSGICSIYTPLCMKTMPLGSFQNRSPLTFKLYPQILTPYTAKTGCSPHLSTLWCYILYSSPLNLLRSKGKKDFAYPASPYYSGIPDPSTSLCSLSSLLIYFLKQGDQNGIQYSKCTRIQWPVSGLWMLNKIYSASYISYNLQIWTRTQWHFHTLH